MAVGVVGIAIFQLGEGVVVDRALDASADAPAVQLERGVGRFIGVTGKDVQLAVGVTALHIDQRGGVREDTCAGADIEVTALADATEAELVGQVIAVALGGGVRPLALDAHDRAADIDVVASADTVEQTVDGLVVAAIIIVHVAAGANMVIAQDRFDAGTGEGGADILRQSRGGDARAGQKSCDHQLAHNRYSIRHSIPHRGRDAQAGAQALVS